MAGSCTFLFFVIIVTIFQFLLSFLISFFYYFSSSLSFSSSFLSLVFLSLVIFLFLRLPFPSSLFCALSSSNSVSFLLCVFLLSPSLSFSDYLSFSPLTRILFLPTLL